MSKEKCFFCDNVANEDYTLILPGFVQIFRCEDHKNSHARMEPIVGEDELNAAHERSLEYERKYKEWKKNAARGDLGRDSGAEVGDEP